MKSSLWVILLLLFASLSFSSPRLPSTPRPKVKARGPNNYQDTSIKSFLTERTCWWNEECKKAFQRTFRCRCPVWGYCRSLGRNYAAHCSFTRTGYIWEQEPSSDRRKHARTPVP